MDVGLEEYMEKYSGKEYVFTTDAHVKKQPIVGILKIIGKTTFDRQYSYSPCDYNKEFARHTCRQVQLVDIININDIYDRPDVYDCRGTKYKRGDIIDIIVVVKHFTVVYNDMFIVLLSSSSPVDNHEPGKQVTMPTFTVCNFNGFANSRYEVKKYDSSGIIVEEFVVNNKLVDEYYKSYDHNENYNSKCNVEFKNYIIEGNCYVKDYGIYAGVVKDGKFDGVHIDDETGQIIMVNNGIYL